MTRFLVSEDNPTGFKLEDILIAIRRDVLTRCTKIADDTRPEANHVLGNNIRVLQVLSDAIAIAENSTKVLNHSFGPSQSAVGGPPRIGEP